MLKAQVSSMKFALGAIQEEHKLNLAGECGREVKAMGLSRILTVLAARAKAADMEQRALKAEGVLEGQQMEVASLKQELDSSNDKLKKAEQERDEARREHVEAMAAETEKIKTMGEEKLKLEEALKSEEARLAAKQEELQKAEVELGRLKKKTTDLQIIYKKHENDSKELKVKVDELNKGRQSDKEEYEVGRD